MIYLASPYSHTALDIMHARYLAAARATAHWIGEGHIIYSPIVHCHDIAVRFRMPRDFEFWQAYNEGMLVKANQMWVLKLDGWELSKGVGHELQFANNLRIPISIVDPPQPFIDNGDRFV